MKFLPTIVAGAIVGALVTYFTLDWQQEKLIFSLTKPAKFGEINYQNIALTNTGWNPAINIKILIEHPNISFNNVQSSSSLKSLNNEKNGIASIERVRRDETIVISLAYKGQPLFGTEVIISSDRSLAELVELDGVVDYPLWVSILIAFFAIMFIGVIASVAIPAYRTYSELAKKAEEKRKNDEKTYNKSLQLTQQYAVPLRSTMYCRSTEFSRWAIK